jgi:hypothetical protein
VNNVAAGRVWRTTWSQLGYEDSWLYHCHSEFDDLSVYHYRSGKAISGIFLDVFGK